MLSQKVHPTKKKKKTARSEFSLFIEPVETVFQYLLYNESVNEKSKRKGQNAKEELSEYYHCRHFRFYFSATMRQNVLKDTSKTWHL